MLIGILIALFCLILLVFVIAPIRTRIIYKREGQNDYFGLEFFLLWSLLPVRLEITSLKGPQKLFVPFFRIKARLTSKGKKPVAKQKEILSASRLYKIIKYGGYYLHLFQPVLLHMANNTKVLGFRWETKLGLGDASSTGIVTGALWTIKGMLSGILYHFTGYHDNYPKLSIEPVYNEKVFVTELDCIFEVRPGNIIISFLKMVMLWLKNRLASGSEQYA